MLELSILDILSYKDIKINVTCFFNVTVKEHLKLEM